MSFESLVDYIGDGIELGGIVVIVVGIAASLVRLLTNWLPGRTHHRAYDRARQAIGRSILLGLELLVAGYTTNKRSRQGRSDTRLRG